MSIDPYIVLGVPKSAPQAEIKKAYRKLAKELHPDDAVKQERFMAVSAAYDLLGNRDKRRRFDVGEIDASGQERPARQYYHHYAGQDAGRHYDPGPGFGDRTGGPRQGGFNRVVHARGDATRQRSFALPLEA